jgi:hypothetical protein
MPKPFLGLDTATVIIDADVAEQKPDRIESAEVRTVFSEQKP